MTSNISPLSQQQRHPASVSVGSNSASTSNYNGSLPSSLIVLLACDGGNNNTLKRRSHSLSSESSSSFSPISSKNFSLPFKKRRFFLIAINDDDDDDDESDEMNASRRSLSPMDEGSANSDGSIERETATQEQQQREASVTTPTRSIVDSSSNATNNTIGEGSSSSSSNSSSFACITPVPRTPKQRKRSTTIVVPKAMPNILVYKPVEETEEEDDKDTTLNASSPAPLPGRSESTEKNINITTTSNPIPMQTRWSKRSGERNISLTSPSNTIDSSINNNTSNRHPKRPTHPRLEAPLPNGCHGQTSRTQSYCRRGPNFNGSKYCKLHYFDPRYKSKRGEQQEEQQEHLRQEDSHPKSSSNTRSTTIAASKSLAAEKEDLPFASASAGSRPIEPPGESSAVSSSSSNSGSNSIKSRAHSRKRVPRDRLYRGSLSEDGGEAEVRCLAISTRGKRCCYTAVDCNGNHYCHRHSSFFHKLDKDKDDSNSNENEETSKIGTETTLRSSNRSSGGQQELLPESQAHTQPELQAHIQLDSHTQAQPPTVPLSNVSTDLWQDRKVLVTRGPHKSRIGTVARWRNGWVTVELSSEGQIDNSRTDTPVVFHNRRSYELFLV